MLIALLCKINDNNYESDNSNNIAASANTYIINIINICYKIPFCN